MADRPPLHIAVTGASRGLGLEFVRQWLDKGNVLFALARDPSASVRLQELSQRHGDALHLVACDVSDDDSVAQARDAVAGLTSSLDIVLSNAGIYGARNGSLDDLQFDDVRRVFEVNTLGPLRVARAFLPLLRCGRQPRLVNVTSLMGSIGDNGSGGSWAYRMSKAALNMAVRNLAHELEPEGVVALVIHPGWVRTDMGGAGAPLGVTESVADMIATIQGVELEHSGSFFSYRGRVLPW